MKRFLLSCFGIGFLPFAPGTWGSVGPVVLFMLLSYLPMVPAGVAMGAFICVILAFSALCIWLVPGQERQSGKRDPGFIVADEVAGQAIAFLPALMMAELNICLTAAAGFALFRLFDISKPWPIKKLEKLPGGWGVLCDDLLAGIYAGIVLFFLLRTGVVDYMAEKLVVDFESLNLLSAAFLGAVQGLTEFLPVSSSGHLVLFENIFLLDPEKPEMLLFDLSVHFGTVVAILIVFRSSIKAFFSNLVACGKYGSNPIVIYKKSCSARMLILAAVATFVTSLVGLSFKHYFASARGSLGVIAAMWTITATLLLIADQRKKTRRGLRQFGLLAAAVIGLAQAAAIMPGISRSGATICAAILLGLHRRWAVEFSFLIAIPAILGATLVETISNFNAISSAKLPLSSLIIAPAVAAVVGIVALKMLINVSRRANMKIFAIYCYILAAVVTAYLFMK